jgi:thioredoxin-related protein
MKLALTLVVSLALAASIFVTFRKTTPVPVPVAASETVPAAPAAKPVPYYKTLFKDSYEAVTLAASKSGKPMVVVFSGQLCPPCQYMKANVYNSPEVKPFHDRFEWAYLDLSDPRNEKAIRIYKVQGIPHLLFLDKAGRVVKEYTTGMFAPEFASVLNDTLKAVGS